MDSIELYVVRNSEGKYLRAIGYNGYGGSWVDLKNAKVYTKKGVAQGRITWFANNFPKFSTLELIPLIATVGEPIDQTARINKTKKFKLKREIEEAQYHYNKIREKFNVPNYKNDFEKQLTNAENVINSLIEKYNKL